MRLIIVKGLIKEGNNSTNKSSFNKPLNQQGMIRIMYRKSMEMGRVITNRTPMLRKAHRNRKEGNKKDRPI
jgi:hypothetical protein